LVIAVAFWSSAMPEPDLRSATPFDTGIGSDGMALPVSAYENGRPNYRYSVVRGGTYTPDEVDQVVDVDAVVAAHYAGVNPDALRVAYLSAPVTAHVSYRIGDDIYWTRRP